MIIRMCKQLEDPRNNRNDRTLTNSNKPWSRGVLRDRPILVWKVGSWNRHENVSTSTLPQSGRKDRFLVQIWNLKMVLVLWHTYVYLRHTKTGLGYLLGQHQAYRGSEAQLNVKFQGRELPCDNHGYVMSHFIQQREQTDRFPDKVSCQDLSVIVPE